MRFFHDWDITAETAKFDAVLDTPIDFESLGRPDLVPIRKFLPNEYPSPFMSEEVLSQRLAVSVFNDLDRYLRVISLICADCVARNVPWYPEGHVPLIPEVGAAGYIAPGGFIPDRCAIIDFHKRIGGVNRCPGDIKCSWKFRGDWKDFIDYDPFRVKTTRRGHGPNLCGVEYSKVMAQLQFYMRNIGVGELEEDSRGRARKQDEEEPFWDARYGYIITDEEVVLVKRDFTMSRKNPEPGRYTPSMHATKGFPLRPKNKEMSGMTVLVLIHLLASDLENFRVERMVVIKPT